MAVNSTTTETVSELIPRVSEWKRFRRVFLGRPLVVFGMVVMLMYVILAIFAPFIAPYDPNLPNLPEALSGPTSTHWLGTDPIGRDTFSRIVYGTRTALYIGLSVVALSCAAGVILGTIAGFYGGWVHTIIMRIIDAFMSFVGQRYAQRDHRFECGHDAFLCPLNVRSGSFS
jgi:ABC-type dipeptide/oligopeptide/nickel transport system permease subunit